MSDSKEVQEYLRENDCHFICPSCDGTLWGTRYLNTEREAGYCKSNGCDFTWPRNEDGEVFYVVTKVNDLITPPEESK